jgi:hypothetical protein
MMPHDPACCERGTDVLAEGRTFVTHGWSAGRRWGYTILADGAGTIVDRWGP